LYRTQDLMRWEAFGIILANNTSLY